MKPLNLNYSVPIMESSSVNGEFIIQGTAIHATTTDNGHKFLVEELRPSAAGLTGVPLLVDHDALVANIKGRVISGTFNEAQEKVDFKAKVMDKEVMEMIKDGRLNSVSVGANVKEIEENDDGTITARGIKFKELSLVAVPADDGATFAIAMSEAYKSIKEESNILGDKEIMDQLDKSSINIKNGKVKKLDLQDMKGGLSEKMEENDNGKVLEAIESMEKNLTESFEKKLDEKLEAVEKSFSEKLEAMKESDADEEPKEESEVESKEDTEEESKEETEEEESEEEEVEEDSKYNIAEGNGTLRGNSFSYNW